MKRKLLWIMMTAFLLQGCQQKQKEEDLNTITEYKCEVSDIVFSLDGLWEENSRVSDDEDIKIELSTHHTETGAELLIFYDDLQEDAGGDLIRLEDYLLKITQELENSEEFSYTLSEISKTILYGKEYKTFQAITDSPVSKHYFYIRQEDQKILSMVVTLYTQDNIREITALGKKLSNG